MKLPLLLVLFLFGVLDAAHLSAQGTRLLRQPTLSEDHVAFAYANDLWIASRAGGDARRLTSFPGTESNPRFSPDGKWLAFSGQYDGNTDVYLLPVEGGEPRRMTWHPSPDLVVGWTPNGREILFTSGRDSAPRPVGKFWTVALDGRFPQKLLNLRAWHGDLSADGRYLAYQEKQALDMEWRNYRGGGAHPIWLLDLADYSVQKLPWEGEQQWFPVWLNKKVYFLSDKDMAMNLHVFDPTTGSMQQLTQYRNFDAKQLQAGGGALVYENGGYLHIFDPEVGQPQQLEIHVRGDLPWARPHWEGVGDFIRVAALSPTGKRALFEARGDIYSVPAENGDVRNLTRSAGVADRTPSWSPNGKHIAWFSDASGEYRLMLGSQEGLSAPKEIELTDPTFYYTPAWSPDSKYLSFTDEGLNIWIVEVETGKAKIVDTDQYCHPFRSVEPVWSPDSKWLAYAKRLDSQFHAVFTLDVETETIHQLTDGMSDALSPVWDAGGKYLYFMASTNFGLNTGWLDMVNYEHDAEYALYVMILGKDEPSPFLPQSDEEEIAEKSDSSEESESSAGMEEGEKSEEDTGIHIDFQGLDQRILALDVPVRSYASLTAGQEGVLFFSEFIENQPGTTIHRYELKENEANMFLTGAGNFTLSSNAEKMLVQVGGSWRIVGTAAPPGAGKGVLRTGDMRMHVKPQAEWQQMFREAWRYQRDYLYVDNIHGADWDAVYRMYQPWVEHIGHRNDLTYLLDILGGEVSVGHSFTGGGDTPSIDRVSTGLLGADITLNKNRYRVDKILTGENWNPNLRAPLSEPGVQVEVGDYILEIDGVEVSGDTNFYAYFEGTVGRQVVLTVNDRPAFAGARSVKVVPIGFEGGLRTRDWVEANRRYVHEQSEGKLAYVWLPDTGQGGYTNFNRYYYAQQDRDGVVIDERYNGGGSVADYIVELMSRTRFGYFNNPVGDRKPIATPTAGIWGPKVMLINDSAGSGGDMLPYMFRMLKIGPLIGTRTWGGLVGIWDVPPLVDGGVITAPRGGFFDLSGNWAVENEGVAPDIQVEMTPQLVLDGQDPQLDRAIRECMNLLETHPVEWLPEPAPPIRAVRPTK